jgi:hypothetical protein
VSQQFDRTWGCWEKSWVGDILVAAKKIPFSIPPLDFVNPTEKSIEGYRKLVERNAEEWLQSEVDKSDKPHMLHGRCEPRRDNPAVQKPLYGGHYLSGVTTASHHEALTSIMVSTHLPALERLRYIDHAQQPVPRHERFRRFCTTEVESPEHALLECQSSPAILNLRAVLLEKLSPTVPELQTTVGWSNSPPWSF